MARRSAGLLVYRRASGGAPEVFLVHPGGPFWAKKDDGAWSIPKGEFGEDEEPLAAAQREFQEETGFTVAGPFTVLTPIKQAGGKWVFAWATADGTLDPDAIRSNTFLAEWPPRSGQQRPFPEVDRAAWFEIAIARKKILPSQMPLLEDLLSHLG